MSEDTARALGAGSSRTVIIAGKECQVVPLTIKDLAEAERICLEDFRRSYLKTYATNLDLLPKDTQAGLLEKKLEEIARWDIASLPFRYAYDPKHIKLTDALETWLSIHMGDYLEGIESKANRDKSLKVIVASGLDSGLLDDLTYKQLTKMDVKKSRVAYVNWWIQGTREGQLTMAWLCFRKYDVTRDEVSDELSKNPQLLNNISREVESISAPATGNG